MQSMLPYYKILLTKILKVFMQVFGAGVWMLKYNQTNIMYFSCFLSTCIKSHLVYNLLFVKLSHV
jgi:hypothetical protein